MAQSPQAQAAKLVRADIKAAVQAGTLGSIPEGITFAVRSSSASMCASVDVSIKGAPEGWALERKADLHHTVRLSADVLALAADVKAIIARRWDIDGRMYFGDVYLGEGLVAA